MSKAQISMWEEKIVDSFAGGGGASTGIELATGQSTTTRTPYLCTRPTTPTPPTIRPACGT